jgi:hemolysin activation/secretion protein
MPRQALEEREVRTNARRRRSFLAVLAGLSSVALGPAALAQVPSTADPAQIRNELTPPPAPISTGSAAPATPLPEQLPPVGAAQISFVLTDIVVDGATAYDPEALRAVYAGRIGQKVSFAEIFDIANALTAKYRADGWILSQVIVPEQQIADGVVHLQAIEGFVDKVASQGEIAGPQSVVDEYLAQIAADRPLANDTLERNILLIGDLPGVNVQSVIAPSAATFGAADLTAVLDHTPFEAFVSVDNRSSRLIGPWSVQIGGSEFSQLGLWEQIDALAAFTPDSDALRYGQVQVTLPLFLPGAFAGDTIQAFASYSESVPDLTKIATEENGLELIGAESEGFEGRITWFHPFIRSRDENLSGRLSFIWKDTTADNTFDGTDIGQTEDHARIVQPRLSWDFVDGLLGVNLIDVEANFGLAGLGASKEGDLLGRAIADGEFTYFNGTLSRLQRLGDGFAVYGEVNGQFSWDALPSSERFGVGGSRFGRGYAPGTITGDNGVAGKVEVQYGDRPQLAFLDSYQLYAFYDFGFTWDIDVPGDTDEALSTLGFGARINVTDTVSLNPEVAQQLTGQATDTLKTGHETMLYLNAVARF